MQRQKRSDNKYLLCSPKDIIELKSLPMRLEIREQGVGVVKIPHLQRKPFDDCQKQEREVALKSGFKLEM